MSTKAEAARLKGDDYHAHFFFYKATEMLSKESAVVKIGLTCGEAKALDDVVVYYRDGYSLGSNPLAADHYQVKFHVRGGSFGYEDLVNPKFINASSVSLLQRVRDAQAKLAPLGTERRFYLYSPWNIAHKDPLQQLILNDQGEIDLDLLASKGPRSKVGKLRQCWMDHLDIDKVEKLQLIVSPLRIQQGVTDFTLLSMLNRVLLHLGLEQIDHSVGWNPYDDLFRKLIENRTTEFTKDQFKALLTQSNLLVPAKQKAALETKKISLRSFQGRAEDVPNTSDDWLCLLDRFKDRTLLEGKEWNKDVAQPAIQFISGSLDSTKENIIRLECHASIAFAAGYAIRKSRESISLLQYTRGGIQSWSVTSDLSAIDIAKDLATETLPLKDDSTDVCVCIGLTHSIRDAVCSYVQTSNVPLQTCYNFEPKDGPGSLTIQSGNHAFAIAEKITADLRSERIQGCVHIFIAAPNAFTFYLGSLARSLGKVQLYEHYFEAETTNLYTPSISFPLEVRA